ncbi:hypothetical protein ACH5RR_000936 [Cinchona calisaya]|uniref:Uncharacterized protein n=1 Tax=Cinchona calisaya TaxID=153742 RepID=A0ABD3B216_9GENT
MLWSVAISNNVEMYELKMRELNDYDVEAFAWVRKAPPPKNWCLAFFSHHTKCDMIMNNICESFNSHILEARDSPIISILETIRKNLMTRIEDRSTWMRKCHGPMGPAIRQIIEDMVKISRQWKPLSNGKGGYEVKNRRTTKGGGRAEEVVVGGEGAEKVATGGGGTEEAVAGGGGVEETGAGSTGAEEDVASGSTVSNANADGDYANSEGNNGNVLVWCKKRKTSQPRRRQIPICAPQPLVNTEPRTSRHTPSTTVHKIAAQNKMRLIEADKAMINSNYAYLGKEPPFKVRR